MDDVWVYVNDNSNSSYSSNYSDIVNSETEAELYSMIHHQENLSQSESQNNDHTIGSNYSNFEDSNNKDLRNPPLQHTEHLQLSLPKNSEHNDHTISRQKANFYSNQESLSSVLYPHITESKNNISAKILSPKKRKSPQTNINKSKQKVIVLESSDSEEKLIWTEFDNSIGADFKTNLLNECNTILSKANSPSPDFFTACEKNKTHEKFKTSLQCLNMKDNFKDLWYVNDNDLYRRSKKSKRYHIDVNHQCSNCGLKGHSEKSCIVPKIIKCFYCGGMHLGSQCQNRICSKCYKIGHDYRQCWMTFVSFCYHCNMKGHVKKDCPDIWRRYHLTTEPVNIISGRPPMQDKSVYCFNCGWDDHFGGVCNEPRFQSTVWPCVISYNNPDELLSKRNDFQRRTLHTHNTVANQSQPYTRLEQFTPPARRVESKSKHLCKAHKKKKKFFEKKAKGQALREAKLVKGKDFPRTSKQTRNQSCFENVLPESVQLEIKRLAKKRKKNKCRKQKKKQQLSMRLPEIITLSP